jgi:hypothetical protein
MNGARIITLGPSNSKVSAASFEEAFGEYSNAGGRDRRKKRKLERIENRTEVKSARQATRQATRADRIAGRTELQQSRKAKRLTKREMGTESRLSRKAARADVRAYKRGLRNPQEAAQEPMPQPVSEQTESQYTEPNQQYAPSGPSGPSGEGYNDQPEAPVNYEQGYEPSEGGYSEDGALYEDGYEGEGVETGDVYDQDLVDETAANAYEMGYQDAQDDSGLDVEIVGEDENYGDFDGIMGAEDRYNERQSKNDMPPAVQNLADKCVWNEVLIYKLKNDRKNSNGNPQMISKTILERAKRLKNLKGELENYANCCGNYSSADGSEEVISQRKKIVQMALNNARRRAAGQPPVSVTPVQRNLKPQFSKERIMIQSKEQMSNATGTGLNGLDMAADYDAPNEREFYLGADGSFTRGIDLGSIAIGVLLTIGFVYLNKQYKWIKL